MTIYERGDMHYHKRFFKSKDKITYIFLGIICLIAIILAIIKIFTPKENCMYEVKLIQWLYTIDIEEYKAVEESGWHLPSNAYDVTTTRKKRGEDDSGDPIYDTWYEYKINRWLQTRTIVTQGLDHEPYWGEVILKPGANENVLGSEREGRRYKHYFASGMTDESDELVTIMIPEDIWNELTKSDELNYKTRPFKEPYDIKIAK